MKIIYYSQKKTYKYSNVLPERSCFFILSLVYRNANVEASFAKSSYDINQVVQQRRGEGGRNLHPYELLEYCRPTKYCIYVVAEVPSETLYHQKRIFFSCKETSVRCRTNKRIMLLVRVIVYMLPRYTQPLEPVFLEETSTVLRSKHSERIEVSNHLVSRV